MDHIPQARRRKLRTWALGVHPSELIGCDNTKQPISLIDLASNDYLGLTRHPALIEAAHKAMKDEGVGAGGSRFITGSRKIHKTLEKELAAWLKRDMVLVFPSGFQANLAAVVALSNHQTTVIADRYIHHSLPVLVVSKLFECYLTPIMW